MENLKTLRRRDVVVHLIGKTQVGKSSTKRCLENLIRVCLNILSGADFLLPNVSVVIGNPPSSSLSSSSSPSSPPSPSSQSSPLGGEGDIGRVLLCLFDISDSLSLREARNLLKPSKYATEITKVLVGNKIDLEYWRKVEVTSGLNLAREMQCQYCEISAFTGMHVDFLVDMVLREMFVGVKEGDLSKVIDDLRSEELGQIAGTVISLNAMSKSINAELERQDALLSALDEAIDKIGKDPTTGINLRSELSTNRDKSKSKWKTFSLKPTDSKKSRRSAGAIEYTAAAPGSRPPRPAPAPAAPTSFFAPLAPPPPASQSSSRPSRQQPPDSNQLLEEKSKEKVSKKEESVVLMDYDEDDAELEEDYFSPPRMQAEEEAKEAISPLQFESDAGPLPLPLPLPSSSSTTTPSSSISIPKDSTNLRRQSRHEDDGIALIESQLESTKAIMVDTQAESLRTEKLEIDDQKEDEITTGVLQLEMAESYQKSSGRVCCKCIGAIICCPCFVTVWLWDSIKDHLKALSKKTALFDNVLADTENAFQSLAKLLVFLKEWTELTLSPCLYWIFGGILNFLSEITSLVVVLCSTIVLILPSFFTLLIVRTSTVEKESKAFGVRQEVIRHEKKEESAIRWFRIILRSLPMSFYILGLPCVLVYKVFAKDPTNKRIITISLVCYLSGVILLQILGSVRAYYSWKTRDVEVPKAPCMYYEEEVQVSSEGITKFLTSCCSGSSNSNSNNKGQEEVSRESVTRVKKKTTPPLPPNTFSFTNPMNLIEVLSLTLEFFQMASFSLQNNPYESDNNSPTPAPTPSPSSGIPESSFTDSIPNFWGKKLFQVLYIHFPVESDLQLMMMWGAIGLVLLLLIVFSLQFLVELRHYGKLMKNIEDKDKAKDSFFFSFTGSIVYGHGKPNNISNQLRLVVSVLSDALFLIISIQLLQAISCDYDNNNTDNINNDNEDNFPTLRSDSSLRCWEGNHNLLATLALTCYGFYVPLSIMITPMLLEAPKQNSSNGEVVVDPGVSYLKLYLMTINVVKSIMLLVGVLGPQIVVTAVISSTIASFVLGGVTYLWFQRNNKQHNNFKIKSKSKYSSSYSSSSSPSSPSSSSSSKSLYSAEIHPCNIAFINYWKAASYTAAVTSSIIVLIAYRLDQDQFPLSTLTYTLIATWIVVILVFSFLYYRFYRATYDRKQLLQELINYPFYFRSIREKLVSIGELKEEEEDSDNDTSLPPTSNSQSPPHISSTPLPNSLPTGNLSSWLMSNQQVDQNKKHIPGFTRSPWLDGKPSRLYMTVDVPDIQGGSFTSELIKYGKITKQL